jgi:periplasmic protein TonB
MRGMAAKVWQCAALTLLMGAPGQVAARPPQLSVPLGNPGDWVTTPDYPAIALSDNLQGTVTFRLTIDTRGRVENCEILQSSGTDILDTVACNLISERARFSAATDARGRPTKGTYTNRVRWVLPRNLPQPRDLSLEATYIVEEDGSFSNCTIVRTEGMSPEEIAKLRTPCLGPATTTPFLDESNNPVRRLVRVRNFTKVEPVP